MQALSDSISRAVFRRVHGGSLVYNTCWEDPRADRPALQLDADATVLMIASAGCNALDYALEGPKAIHAVDVNFRQIALLELKIAGIRTLDFDQFFALFGDGGHPDFARWYAQHLRAGLSPPAQAFWDARTHWFARSNPADSFYHHGTTGSFGRWMVGYLRAIGLFDACEALFAATTVAEQRRIYQERIRPRLWRPWLRRLLEGDTVLSLLGVPRAQREHIERTTGRSVAAFIEAVIESVCTELPIHDNYFWRLYVFGRYTRDCCPRYLQHHEFARLKAGLVDRVRPQTIDVTGFLARQRESISHFVLLDHMDWLARAHPAQLQAEWQAILDGASEDARILWRSGGLVVDYVDPLRVEVRGRQRRVGELLHYDHALAARCNTIDRVRTYGSFYIAELRR